MCLNSRIEKKIHLIPSSKYEVNLLFKWTNNIFCFMQIIIYFTSKNKLPTLIIIVIFFIWSEGQLSRRSCMYKKVIFDATKMGKA